MSVAVVAVLQLEIWFTIKQRDAEKEYDLTKNGESGGGIER